MSDPLSLVFNEDNTRLLMYYHRTTSCMKMNIQTFFFFFSFKYFTDLLSAWYAAAMRMEIFLSHYYSLLWQPSSSTLWRRGRTIPLEDKRLGVVNWKARLLERFLNLVHLRGAKILGPVLTPYLSLLHHHIQSNLLSVLRKIEKEYA